MTCWAGGTRMFSSLLAALIGVACFAAPTDGPAVGGEGDEGKGTYVNRVVVSVFGETGPQQDEQSKGSPSPLDCVLFQCPDVPKGVAQFMMTAILRSMLKGQDDDADHMLSPEPPDVSINVVPPFEYDKYLPKGMEGDQRSPFYRTFFRFAFAGLSQSAAEKVAKNMCEDYQRQEEELLKGLFVALSTKGMWPRQALSTTLHRGLSFSSFIHLSSAVESPSGGFLIGRGCNWDVQAQFGTQQGAFFLPPCPKNSHQVNESEPWRCECNPGYEGTIRYEFFEDNLKNQYDGSCELVEGFCQGEFPMRLRSGEPARGVLEEEAYAVCPEEDGYQSTGLARCTRSGAQGAWIPWKLCRFAVPEELPAPLCPPPERPGLVLQDCGACLAELPPIEGAPCQCKAHCDQGYKQWDDSLQKYVQASGFTDPPIACLNVPYQCPKEDSLIWNVDSGDGSRCVDSSTKQPLKDRDACCPEAWGSASKPSDLRPNQCRDVRDEAECFKSKQADGTYAGHPCCWHTAAEHATDQEDVVCAPRGDPLVSSKRSEFGCAVPRQIPEAHWEEKFPTCKPICLNNFKELMPDVVSEGCDTCLPGSDPDCHCKVSCRPGTVFYGGGQLGRRTCSDLTNDFGPAPLCKEPPPLNTKCPARSPSSMSEEGSCDECEVGKPCNCKVRCAATHKHRGKGEEGAKECVLADSPVVPVSCMQVTERAACVNSKDDKRDADGEEVPCCWRDDAFSDGSTQCVPRGSALIDAAHQPSMCAPMKVATWSPALPECALLCVHHFHSIPFVTTNGLCDSCLPGEECGCQVHCLAGAQHYGGGSTTVPRVCDPDTLSFGEAPVCGPPRAPLTCARSELENAKLAVTACEHCLPGEECVCIAFCPLGFADVKRMGVPPSCKEDEAGLSPGDCAAIKDADTCLESEQQGTSQPCCWLGRDDGETPCLPKGSDLIRSVPAACARPKVHWDNLPDCKEKCKNSLRRAQNLQFRPSLEACDNCIVGMPCDCEVACAEGTLHYGGGPLHHRGCTESKRDLGEPPLCSSPKQTLQPCMRPDESEFLVDGECTGCLPGAEGCHCKVDCRPKTHKLISGQSGTRTCIKDVAGLPQVTCTDIKGEGAQGTCLGSREHVSGPYRGKPCCYHPSEVDGDTVCAPMHSDIIGRPVSACAEEYISRWEPPLPDCQPLCTNIFAGVAEIRPQDCDGCVVGAPDCPCKVFCSPDMDWYGGPPQGDRPCSASGQFQAPPVCGPKEAVPECRRSDIPNDESLRVEQCEACTATADGSPPAAKCNCGVWCRDEFLDTGTGGREGSKSCRLITSSGDAACAEIQDRRACVASLQGSTPCIWLGATAGGAGVCRPNGSPDVAAVPDASNIAPLMRGEWEPMPKCLRRCTHDLRHAPNVVASKGCDRCHVGQKAQSSDGEAGADTCQCIVTCRPGTERYGGGPEGPRSCSEDQPRFEPPPMCLPPREVWCHRPLRPDLSVEGCANCLLGGPGCGPCRVGCGRDYVEIGGGGSQEKTCKKVSTEASLLPGKCGEISDPLSCLGSAEQDEAGVLQPCCYRAGTFSQDVAGQRSQVLCARKGSSLIPWDQPPDDCAPVAQGVWEGLPVCEQKCKDTFQALRDTYSKDCDKCIPSMGESCPCRVFCKDPAKALTGLDRHGMTYPREGRRQCLQVPQLGRAEFEPPPLCLTPCLPPGSDGGTLDVSQCSPEGRPDGAECFPGVLDCKCVVRCAADFRLVGGGANGGNFYCNEAGKYTGLPICRPFCEKPDDQYGQLDTSACTPCVAGSRNCDCNLRCRGRRVGGGQEGKYTCSFLPGDDETLARGVWVAEKPGWWGDQPGLPSCLSPIFVTAVSATTKEGMKGVAIEVFLDDRRIASKTTGRNGEVQLDMISNEDVVVVASLKGYAKITRRFQRTRFCLDPKVNCGMQLSLSPVLKFGMVQPDGCYFTALHEKPEWEMRAVLEWTNDPKDLDIWARNLDCFTDTARRYRCPYGKYSGCKRYRFAKKDVRDSEVKACGIKLCNEDGDKTALVGDRPDCPDVDPNQFPKWVYFGARYASNMHQRIRDSAFNEQVKIKTTTIRIVTVAGFVDIIEKRYCEGKPCSSLDGDFVERQGGDYMVSDQETYWKGNAYLIYYCHEDDTWHLSAARTFKDVRSGSCRDSLARSEVGKHILSHPMVAFPEVWDGKEKQYQTLEGPRVVRLHDPEGPKDRDWNPDHYMFLNVDHQTGYGPETVTFQNVPPATYQIVVNTFSENDVNRKNLRDGKPVVAIYLGGNEQAIVECEISPACQNVSRIWNVMNIQVFDGGPEMEDGQVTEKDRFYIRIFDMPETLQRLYEVDLPKSDAASWEEKKYDAPPHAKAVYFQGKGPEQYNDEQLKYVCHGQCKAAPGYEQCIQRPM